MTDHDILLALLRDVRPALAWLQSRNMFAEITLQLAIAVARTEEAMAMNAEAHKPLRTSPLDLAR